MTIRYAPHANPPLPPWAEAWLEARLVESGLDSCEVTSTLRSPDDQARIMFEMYQANGAAYVRRLYPGRLAQRVMDVVDPIPAPGLGIGDLQDRMAGIIREKPRAISTHIDNGDGTFTFDVAPSSVGGVGGAFDQAVQDSADRGEVKVYLKPPQDPAFHMQLDPDQMGGDTLQAVQNAITPESAQTDGEELPVEHQALGWFAGGLALVASLLGIGALVRRLT